MPNQPDVTPAVVATIGGQTVRWDAVATGRAHRWGVARAEAPAVLLSDQTCRSVKQLGANTIGAAAVARRLEARSGPLEVHVVDGRPPVAAPLPTSIGEDVYGGIAAMQKARVGAAAVQVCRRILRLECARGANVRIENPAPFPRSQSLRTFRGGSAACADSFPRRTFETR
jgi:hypothetical protein